MSFIDALDNSIQIYFKDILEFLDFMQYEENTQGMGALRKFKNKNLKIQIINDRDFKSLEISSIHGDEDFNHSNLINALIDIETQLKGKLDIVHKKSILQKQLDLESQAIFLKNKYDILTVLLNKDNYSMTLRKLNELAKERAKIVYGWNI
jgi:hypothetical protein